MWNLSESDKRYYERKEQEEKSKSALYLKPKIGGLLLLSGIKQMYLMLQH